MRVIEVNMERCRNEGMGEWEIPEKTRRPAASSGTISACESDTVSRCFKGEGLRAIKGNDSPSRVSGDPPTCRHVVVTMFVVRDCLLSGRQPANLLSFAVSPYTFPQGVTVVERLARSPPTKANRAQSPAGPPDLRKWESCRTMPLVGGSSRRFPAFPAPAFRRRSTLASLHPHRALRIKATRHSMRVPRSSLSLRTRICKMPSAEVFNFRRSLGIYEMQGREKHEGPEKTFRRMSKSAMFTALVCPFRETNPPKDSDCKDEAPKQVIRRPPYICEYEVPLPVANLHVPFATEADVRRSSFVSELAPDPQMELEASILSTVWLKRLRKPRIDHMCLERHVDSGRTLAFARCASQFRVASHARKLPSVALLRIKICNIDTQRGWSAQLSVFSPSHLRKDTNTGEWLHERSLCSHVSAVHVKKCWQGSVTQGQTEDRDQRPRADAAGAEADGPVGDANRAAVGSSLIEAVGTVDVMPEDVDGIALVEVDAACDVAIATEEVGGEKTIGGRYPLNFNSLGPEEEEEEESVSTDCLQRETRKIVPNI
ncbi:hypothetical protein PR048_010511 [Dryococelus australis]|uniref:Uncharacterized protein n=1 Tax=Dryococelus australis TaxID=614101 RepID=A0ABQ9I2X2_9NEOP|nr:hypothetical protein PR048_010511 [Dryococelus australis]